MSDPRTGLTVVHRRYVPYAHAHYAGDLVDGAYGLGLVYAKSMFGAQEGQAVAA